MTPLSTPTPAPDIVPAEEPKGEVVQDIGGQLQTLLAGVVNNAATPEVWQQISQTLEAGKESVKKLTESQLQTLMSQVDALQQKVLDTPQAMEIMDVLKGVRERIQSVRTEAYERMQKLLSATGTASVAGMGEVLSQLDGVSGGVLKKVLPGMPNLAGLGKFFQADGFGGSLLRTAQRFFYGALQNAGSTKVFGMELKSLFGNVFAGNTEALAALDVEDALRVTIKKLNGERKQGQPLFSLPGTWNGDEEALVRLEEARGSVPLPEFLSKQLKQFSKVFDGGPVTLCRLADALERKPVATKKEPASPKVEAAVPATAIS